MTNQGRRNGRTADAISILNEENARLARELDIARQNNADLQAVNRRLRHDLKMKRPSIPRVSDIPTILSIDITSLLPRNSGELVIQVDQVNLVYNGKVVLELVPKAKWRYML